MSNKHTYCPSCMTTYKVTVAQLTVAQGLVCCPKCDTSFNALSHLVTEKKSAQHAVTESTTTAVEPKPSTAVVTQQSFEHSSLLNHQVLEIFDRKIENSNIDLKTYLNNLNYFSTEPIGTLPAVNWSDQEEVKKRSVLYYLSWTIFNVVLIGTLLFQFFWFNPQYLQHSTLMSKAFYSVCDIVQCNNLQEHYNLITTTKVKVKRMDGDKSQFRGALVNYHDRSLALPILKVTLKNNNEVVAEQTLQPKEYLIESLAGIERIPQNSPFQFEFTLPVDRKTFDSYEFEIIQP